jgi:hypothetical protein
MYFFPAHHLGFFHIPKTGGTSVSAFLIEQMRARGDAEREVTLKMYHEPIGNKIEALGKDVFDRSVFITTVRNPYAAVVSLYFWYQRKSRERHADLDVYPESDLVARMTFDEYLDWYVANGRPFDHYLVENGEIPHNVRVIKLEDVDAGLFRVLNGELGLGIAGRVPVFRTTVHEPFMTYLDPNAIRKINSMYRWSFDSFYPDERVGER